MDQRSELQANQEAVSKYFKLIISLVDVGADALRSLLQKNLSNDDLATVIEGKGDVLQDLLQKKVLTQSQLELLQEVPPNPSEFDISLLVVVLRHFCQNIQEPAMGWNVKEPKQDDHSTGAELLRLRQIRNHSAHLPSPEMTDTTYENLWNELVCTIVRITLSISNEATATAIRKIGKIENMEINPAGTTEKAAFQRFKKWQTQATDIIQDKLESLEKYVHRFHCQNETIEIMKDDIKDVKLTGACTKEELMQLKRQMSEIAKDVSSICVSQREPDYGKMTEALMSSLPSLSASSRDRSSQSENEAAGQPEGAFFEGLEQQIETNKEKLKCNIQEFEKWDRKMFSISLNAKSISIDQSKTFNISGGTQHIETS